MKKHVLILFAFVAVLNSCVEESLAPRKGSIQFSHSVETGGKTKGVSTPAKVLVTISNAAGDPIISGKMLELITFGSGYISDNLELPVGNYLLTQFVILDSDNNAIYATPLEGSDLADLVSDPLPIQFEVTENGVTLITPQVILIDDNATPEKFGYVSFGFEIVGDDSKQLKQLIISEYDNYKGDYIAQEKRIYLYEGERLTTIEIYYYLPEYKVYYLGYSEKYSYDEVGRVNEVHFINHYNESLLWRYTLSYPSENSVKWEWWTILSGYPDDLYYSHILSRNGENFDVGITLFPNHQYPSYNHYDGKFGNGNMIVKNSYYENELYATALTTYDNHPNPLYNLHHFFRTEDPASISVNNPLTIVYESPNQSQFTVDYSYEYNESGYPTKCYIKTTNSDATVQNRQLDFKY